MINDLFHTYKKIIVIILILLCSVVFWFYGCRDQNQGQDDVVKWECTKKKGSGRGSYRFETADFSGTVVFGTAGYVAADKKMPVTLRITCKEKSFTGVMKITLPGGNGKGIAWQSAVKCNKGMTRKIILLVPQLGNPSAFSFEILDSFGVSKLSEVVRVADLKGTDETAQEEDGEEMLFGVLSDSYKELSWLDGAKADIGTSASSEDAESTVKVTLVRLTAKNFPADTDELAALDGLLIDSFDVTTLSEKQISCLKTWVSEGGNLMIGTENQAKKQRKALTFLDKLEWTETDDGNFMTAPYEKGEISLLSFPLIGEDYSAGEDQEAVVTALSGRLIKEEQTAEDNETSLWYIKKALYAFRKSQLPNTFYYGVFFITYLFLIVLIAYYFLRRIKKREYIWAVVPALAVVFTLILVIRSVKLAGSNDGAFSALRIMDTDREETKVYLLCQNEEAEERSINLVSGISSVVPLDYEYQTGSSEGDSMNLSGEDLTVNNTSKGFDISLSDSVPGASRLLKLTGDGKNTEAFSADFSTTYTAFSGTVTNNTGSDLSRLILVRGGQYVILKNVKAGEKVTVAKDAVRYRNTFDKDNSTFGDEDETTVLGNLMEYVQQKYMDESAGQGEILAVGITDDSDFRIFSDKNKLKNHVTVMVSHFAVKEGSGLQSTVTLNQSCLEVEEDTEEIANDTLEKKKTEVRYQISDPENIWALVRNRDSFEGTIYAYNYYTGEKDELLNSWDERMYPSALSPYLSESGEMILTYETAEDTEYASAPVLTLISSGDQ